MRGLLAVLALMLAHVLAIGLFFQPQLGYDIATYQSEAAAKLMPATGFAPAVKAARHRLEAAQALSPPDSRVAQARLDLAILLRWSGSPAESVQLLSQSIPPVIAAQGEGSLMVAQIRYYLGRLQMDLGQPRLAIGLLKPASASLLDGSGSDDLGYQACTADLGLALAALGRTREAYLALASVRTGLMVATPAQMPQVEMNRYNQIFNDCRTAAKTLP